MPTPNGQLYALYVVFVDGNKRIRYSRDFKHGRDKKLGKKRDSIIGIQRFFGYLKKFEGRIKTFEIYDHSPGKPQDGEKVFKWENNQVLIDRITHLVTKAPR